MQCSDKFVITLRRIMTALSFMTNIQGLSNAPNLRKDTEQQSTSQWKSSLSHQEDFLCKYVYSTQHSNNFMHNWVKEFLILKAFLLSNGEREYLWSYQEEEKQNPLKK